jgi:hypothetical protein
MSIWVRNERKENDPTPLERPAFETDYIQSGSSGPRQFVAQLQSIALQSSGSGILIAPDLVLTAWHVVGPNTGQSWTADIGGVTYQGTGDLQLRSSGNLFTGDLAVLQIQDTGYSVDDLYGLAVFSGIPDSDLRASFGGTAITAGFPGQLYHTEAAAIAGDISQSATGPM